MSDYEIYEFVRGAANRLPFGGVELVYTDEGDMAILMGRDDVTREDSFFYAALGKAREHYQALQSGTDQQEESMEVGIGNKTLRNKLMAVLDQKIDQMGKTTDPDQIKTLSQAVRTMAETAARCFNGKE